MSSTSSQQLQSQSQHKDQEIRDPLSDNPNLLDDYDFRRQAAKTFDGFCLIYLPHYLQLEPADFHPELLETLGNHAQRFIEIVGFRGSAKSTFGSLALVLWAALEHPDRYPFIIPIADTSIQSGMNIANIKYELDNNPLLLQDYGSIKAQRLDDPNPEPSLESDEEWQAKNMLLSNGVRILARSRGQKIRGLRHRQHRPKLAIVDDPEDLEWVRTKDNRDKTERWLRGEVIPGIDQQTGRLIVIGNYLSSDALMARLKRDTTFKHFEFPLIDSEKNITWPALYPDQAAIDALMDRVKLPAFMREYLLKAIPEEGQIITERDIHYYDELPPEASTGLHGTGVDLAISKKATADYTAMVSGISLVAEDRPAIYISPSPINARLDFRETINAATSITLAHPFSVMFVEDVQYQHAAIEEMERAMLPVTGVKPTTDKRSRLMTIAPYIKNGTVRFPRTGCEDLILQLLGFGVEEHDDLVDALVHLVSGLVQQGIKAPEITALL